jgi:predicted transcriptional regulator
LFWCDYELLGVKKMEEKKEIKFPKLLAVMASRGDSQGDLAKVLGLSQPVVSMRFSGRIDWSISEVDKVCKHYNLSYYDLFV